jgi:hypothetical protein
MTTKALERQVGRVFSPRAHCGLNATGVTSPIRKIFGRDVAVWVFALEKLRGLDRDGFDVAIETAACRQRGFRIERRVDFQSSFTASRANGEPASIN